MQNKPFRLGPVALTTVLTTNILNPPVISGGVGAPNATATYILLKHLRVTNKTAAAATFSLWIGATGANAAGTEFWDIGRSVPPNSSVEWGSPGLRLNVADFLVGGSNTAAALTLTGEGEIGVA